jgi:2,3-bisphosphoglycerate-dependent phosphoglycerate mutase
VTTTLVFETHGTTLDNEAGRAAGWEPGALSARGREEARELGLRRRADGIAAVFVSDLGRAVETVRVAFGDQPPMPVLLDWRLRECDYGSLTGVAVSELTARRREFLDQPYPGGESWRQAVVRVGGFVADFPDRWRGQRVLVVGHRATRWGLDVGLAGQALEDLVGERFGWQPGWEYHLD